MTWLRRLYRRWTDRHDAAWDVAYAAHGGARDVIGTYSYAKAVAGKKRAEQRQQKARKIAAQIEPKAKADVTPFHPQASRRRR